MSADRPRVLVVDDHPDLAELLAEQLEEIGCAVCVANGGPAGLALFRESPADVVVTDLCMPGLDGMGLLDALVAMDPTVPVIMITAQGGVRDGVRAIKAGAFHFLAMPYEFGELHSLVQAALETRRLRQENAELRSAARGREGLRALIGSSEVMQRLYELVERVARSPVPVLIRGESGSGKELVARALHELSPRSGGPFVALNCTTLPQTLLESELFGHVRGAFTGAATSRKGLFAEAEGGTLLLDEIGDMPPDLQARLLRVLQEGMVRPVGSDSERKVDVRVLAATHQPLEVKVADGDFREDLFYRLNVVSLNLPPLRERMEDVPALISHFLVGARAEMPESTVGRFTPRLVAALARRPWPGNVRELRNAVRRLVVLCPNEVADIEELALLPSVAPSTGSTGDTGHNGAGRSGGPPDPAAQNGAAAEQPLRSDGGWGDPARGRGFTSSDDAASGSFPTLEEIEKLHIERALQRTGGNKTAAAKLLGTDRKTLSRRLARAARQQIGDEDRAGGSAGAD